MIKISDKYLLEQIKFRYGYCMTCCTPLDLIGNVITCPNTICPQYLYAAAGDTKNKVLGAVFKMEQGPDVLVTS